MVGHRTLMSTRTVIALGAAAWLVTVEAPRAQAPENAPQNPHADALFETADNCMACHNGLTGPDGEDLSIGVAWRATMMANSARDPYWHAAVRRETIDHPQLAGAIEDECAICHMPMARAAVHAAGEEMPVFANLPLLRGESEEQRLAADGVSCMLCHQISADGLGTPESFVGGFALNPLTADGAKTIVGPFEVTEGHQSVMRSSALAEPVEGTHIRESEMCATCHTLITQAYDGAGNLVGSLPEQVPYQEWEHSAFPGEEQSCQSCHMPRAEGPLRISSVLGEDRDEMGRHTFIGGNFFMLRILNRFRDELGVEAYPSEMEMAVRRTVDLLQQETASVTVASALRQERMLRLDLAIRSRTGHKLPTAYPSRRAWLHVTVRDAQDRVVFESGRVEPSGAIVGNDNDADASRYEPHYERITAADQVQIYEAIMTGPNGAVTTGLLAATQYIKDNRLLPRGFDKATAGDDVAVHGAAEGDADCTAPGDDILYAIDLGAAPGPFRVDVALQYQNVSFRWADNLRAYDAPEPQRFVRYYDEMSPASTVTLATATATVN